MEKFKLAANWTFNGIFALLAFGLGLVLFWTFEPAKPIVALIEWQTNCDEGTKKTQFHPGETVYSWRKVYATKETHHTKVWRIVIRDVNNETIASYETQPIPAPAGESVRLVKLVTLPKDVKPGMYRVQTYGTYALNPLRDATYELLPRITFEVVP